MALSALSLLTLKSLKPIFLIVSLLYFINDHLLTENEHGELHYSYVPGTPTGPENWGDLHETWRLCSTGQSQSPINALSHQAVLYPTRESLRTYYLPAKATLINSGHDVQVEWADGNAGGIMINNDVYILQQGHWHTPSEHTVNFKRYEMELHLVHTNYRGDIAVIGILYKLGSSDPFLAQLLPHLESAGTTQQEVDVGYVNPDDTCFDKTSYYRYNGSLTTPPCSENVKWTVIKKVNTVSQAQILSLKNAVDADAVENARPVQKVNRRTVVKYQQFFKDQASSANEGHSAAM